MILTIVQKIAIWAIPVLLAITLHEAAHAWIASRCGDTTAKALGRLSINPVRHISLVGTLLVPLMIGILSHFQFIFGWAKPVPIHWNRLRRPRRDSALVAAAGPIANIIMTLLWAMCFKIATMLHPEQSMTVLFLLLTAQAGIIVNLILAFLNLIPIPPLDGSRIIFSALPPRYAEHYMKLEPFGFFILLALMLSGGLSALLSPALSWSLDLIQRWFNV